MREDRVIEMYFNRLKDSGNCKKFEIISGEKYIWFQRGKRSEITRFFIDENLDVSMCKFKSKIDWEIQHIDESDLLIIGFCLQGEKIIDYNGKHRIKAGEVFYFRPREDYRMEIDNIIFWI